MNYDNELTSRPIIITIIVLYFRKRIDCNFQYTTRSCVYGINIDTIINIFTKAKIDESKL